MQLQKMVHRLTILLPLLVNYSFSLAHKSSWARNSNAALIEETKSHSATLHARSVPPPSPSPTNPEPEGIEALRRANSRFRNLYGGADKKELRATLRAGGGTAEQRAEFAQLERDAQAYRKYTYELTRPPRPQSRSTTLDLGAVDDIDAVLTRLRGSSSDFRNMYLGPENRERRERLYRADRAASASGGEVARGSDAGGGASAEAEVSAEELEHFRRTRAAYNAYQNLYKKRARRDLKQLKLKRDRYEREFLAGTPESDAARARLAAGQGTSEQIADFRELRRAYEDYEAKFGLQQGHRPRQSLSDLAADEQSRELNPQRKQQRTQPGKAGAVASSKNDMPRPQPPPLNAAERQVLRQQANAYQRDYVRKPALKRLLDRGGGTAAQREAYAAAKKAYNTHQALIARTQARIPRTRVAYYRDVAAEVGELEALRADHNAYVGLMRSATRLGEFLADNARGAKRAEFERLRAASLRYRHLYRVATLKTRDKEAAAASGGPKDEAASAGGATRQRRQHSRSWMQHLSADELLRIQAVAPGRGEWYRLGLSNEAGRQVFVADDPTGEKRALLESYHADYLEYTRIYKKAKRIEAKLASFEGAAQLPNAGNEYGELDERGEGQLVTWSREGRRRYFRRNARRRSAPTTDVAASGASDELTPIADPPDDEISLDDTHTGGAQPDGEGGSGGTRLSLRDNGSGWQAPQHAQLLHNFGSGVAQSLRNIQAYTRNALAYTTAAARDDFQRRLTLSPKTPVAKVANFVRPVMPRY